MIDHYTGLADLTAQQHDRCSDCRRMKEYDIMALTPAIADVDITSSAFKANPTVRGKQRAWLVTRYDDVSAILKDERCAKNQHNAKSL